VTLRSVPLLLARDVEWIGVEPNRFLHPQLHARLSSLGLAGEVRLGAAEHLPVADASVDAVVSSLVLCSVHDVEQTLREVRRVLRPGGSLVFIEHVAAPRRTLRRFVQRGIRPLWAALGDGCHPDRDTAASLERAGFAVELRRLDLPISVIGPHIAGIAKPAVTALPST
jgi:ubiquinone/menaquinone biosynthesis C-methylase UbiE